MQLESLIVEFECWFSDFWLKIDWFSDDRWWPVLVQWCPMDFTIGPVSKNDLVYFGMIPNMVLA
jgi:hypothetical protein